MAYTTTILSAPDKQQSSARQGTLAQPPNRPPAPADTYSVSHRTWSPVQGPAHGSHVAADGARRVSPSLHVGAGPNFSTTLARSHGRRRPSRQCSGTVGRKISLNFSGNGNVSAEVSNMHGFFSAQPAPQPHQHGHALSSKMSHQTAGQCTALCVCCIHRTFPVPVKQPLPPVTSMENVNWTNPSPSCWARQESEKHSPSTGGPKNRWEQQHHHKQSGLAIG